MVRADTAGELQGVEPIIITSSPLILSSSQQMALLAQAVDLQPDFLKKPKWCVSAVLRCVVQVQSSGVLSDAPPWAVRLG